MKIEECEDLNRKVELFSNLIEEALNEAAPLKTFTVKTHHKFGLSEKTNDEKR